MPPPGILDKVAAEPIYAEATKQAERDLPGDTWTSPWRINASRYRREWDVAQQILAKISPKLKGMSVTQLVKSLKVTSRSAPHSLHPSVGVAACVFVSGNSMIIAEIQSRPKSELAVLPSLADEKLVVWQGPDGLGDSLDFLIHHCILNDR